MNNSSIEQRIERALFYLTAEQLPSGQFQGMSFNGNTNTPVPTVFTSSLIAVALCAVKGNELAQTIHLRITEFLKTQRSEGGTWNYFVKESAEYQSHRYPDDMDDTALALASIITHDSAYFDGIVTALLARTLTAVEIQEGGPYNTWITDFEKDTRWEDVDIAVNANVAYLLSLLDIELPKLTEYFDECLKANALTSRYYTSVITLLYFLSRTYNGPYKQSCIDTLESAQVEGHWETPLETALALSALHRFGAPLEQYASAVEYLHDTSQNGHWEKYSLYLDNVVNDSSLYHGSSALTTAFCVEALSLFLQSIQSETVGPEEVAFIQEQESIVFDYRTQTSKLSPEFALLAERSVDEVLRQPLLCESMTLSYRFSDAYGAHSVPTETLHQLGLANLYGWVGYTVLDTVMDGEFDKYVLPFSVYCTRSLVALYREILPGEHYRLVEDILNQTDRAYMQEYAAHLPVHEQRVSIEYLPARESIPTYQKSLGHALPALALLLLEDYPLEGEIVLHARTFFEEYLHLHQYSDDAHDIIEDLATGQLTQTLHDTLTEYKKQYPHASTIHVVEDETALLEVFWRDVFPRLYDSMKHSAKKATKALRGLPLVDASYFTRLIDDLVEQQEKALKERAYMYQFLSAY